MTHLKLALRLDCLRLPLRKALRRSAQLGVSGVQFNAAGELAPQRLSATGRRELAHLTRTLGLQIVALGFPTRRGFNTDEGLEDRLQAARGIMDMSYNLGAPVVTAAIGRIPEDPEHPSRTLAQHAMLELGRHGDRVGAVFAIETGTESGATLRGFLDGIAATSVQACYDPGNLIVKGYDPIDGVRQLGQRIVMANAHDATRNLATGLGASSVPGDGDLDWQAYLGALEEVEYRGWLTIRLDRTENPEKDVARAIAFLRQS